MAHMLVAGLNSRGLGFCSLQRASLKVACKQKLFVVGRVHPATLKPLLAASPPSRNSPPRQFALNYALPDSSSTSSPLSQDEALISSTEDCPDGSILFMLGNLGQQVSEQAAVEVSKSEANVAVADHNGSITSASTVENEKLVAVFFKDTKAENQSRSLVNKDAAHEVYQEVQTKDACITTHEKLVESQESIIKNQGVLRLRSGGAIRPHPSKVKSGGEDAYVIEGTSWAGVADGVGGWALSGVDSGLYSRELMSNCGLLAKSEKGVPNPKAVIIEAVRKTKAVGTCTAVLAALHKQTLHVANVGDSGFLVVRNGEALAKSMPMQHGFNFPYQIGSEGDDPATAETFKVPIASGDVLVLATDGVYDNLYEREIVEIVDLGQKKGVEPGTVAEWLVKIAHQAGLNTGIRSPFSDAAQAAGYSYKGGKLDDATVVVSYVE